MAPATSASAHMGRHRLTVILLGIASLAVVRHPSSPVVYTYGAYSSGSSNYAKAPRNCTEARAWRLENIPRDSPYYASWIDADDDGLARRGHRDRGDEAAVARRTQ
jgi:excalibur calcium-binding domain-containing protein